MEPFCNLRECCALCPPEGKSADEVRAHDLRSLNGAAQPFHMGGDGGFIEKITFEKWTGHATDRQTGLIRLRTDLSEVLLRH